MPVGKIISTANDVSNYARVRDEHGQEYTVHASELPKGAEEGDGYAYKVDVFNHSSGLATTLKSNNFVYKG